MFLYLKLLLYPVTGQKKAYLFLYSNFGYTDLFVSADIFNLKYIFKKVMTGVESNSQNEFQ